jgi:hypothetical protein
MFAGRRQPIADESIDSAVVASSSSRHRKPRRTNGLAGLLTSEKQAQLSRPPVDQPEIILALLLFQAAIQHRCCSLQGMQPSIASVSEDCQ